MGDLSAKLAECGIRLSNYDIGEKYSTCPECSAQRKKKTAACLSVKIDDRSGAVWFCNHCGWKGNIPGDQDHRSSPERPSEEPQYRPGRQLPVMPVIPDAMFAWFDKRGVSRETVESLRVYFLTRVSFPQIEARSQAIAFPYFFEGRAVNTKYRSPKKLFRQDPKTLRTLYNVDSLLDNDTAIIAEGEMDVLSLVEVGYPSVVSLPDGAPAMPQDPKDEHRRWEIRAEDKRYLALKNCAEQLAPIKRFILATDSDPPGETLAHQLAHRLGVHRCWRAKWPADCKDPNEVLVKHGPESLRRAIDQARGFPIKGLYEITPGMLRDYRLSPKRKTFQIGLEQIDKYMTFRPRQVVVVTGWPADGKTEIVDFFIVFLAMQYGWKWAVCSPEHELEEHGAKLAEKYIGQPFYDYGLTLRGMDDDHVALAEHWIGKHFTFIAHEDEDTLLTLDYILEKARAAWLRHDIKGLVIDPYNEIQMADVGMSKTDWVAALMSRLKKFARHHDLLVFLIAHPPKLSRDRQSGKRPAPTLHDIADSANFFNKCDIGFTVWRPSFDKFDVDLMIQKVKRKDQGRPGIAKLHWDKETGRYKARG